MKEGEVMNEIWKNQGMPETPQNPLKTMPVDNIMNSENKEGGREENPVR